MHFFLKYRVLGLLANVCFLMIGCSSLKAQSAKDTLKLKEIEYSYKIRKIEKATLNTIKLDSAVLAENTSISLAEIINRNTTAFIKTYSSGGIATPSIRGTAANHSKIYWNNIPVNSSSLGTMDLSIIPVFLLDDIELQYGAAGLEQGSGSLGAGINLSSALPGKRLNTIQFQQSAGSFGTYQTYAGTNYSYKSLSASTKLYYQVAENKYPFRNTFLLNAPLQEQRNAAFTQYGLMQQAAYAFTPESVLSFSYWYHHRQREVPSPMFTLMDSASQIDYSSRAVLSYKFKKNKHEFSALTSISGETLNFKNDLKRINSLSKGTKIFSKADYKKLIHSKLTFHLQLNSTLDKVKIDDYKTDSTKAERRQERYGLYAKLAYQPFRRAGFDFSFRQELINFRLMPAAFTFSADFKLIKDGKLNFLSSFGRNYNYPSLNDLYWAPGGNPALQPEKSWSADIGLASNINNKEQKEIIKTSVTVFNLLVDNWIQWQPGTSGYWEAKNLRKVWSRGIETKVIANLLNRKITSFTTDFSYSFTRSTNLQTHNPLDNSLYKQLIYIPLHVFRTAARLNLKDYFLIAEYNFNGYTYTSPDNSSYLPDYSLVNLTAVKKFKFSLMDGLLMLKINNVFNTSYQVIEWYAMPGRYFEITLKLNVKLKK